MSNSRCIVVTCKNMGTHNFPKDETLKRQWIKATRLNTQRKFGPNAYIKSARICSSHFKSSDYVPSTILSAGVRERKILKRNVIPSIFPWSNTKDTSTTLEPPVALEDDQSTCEDFDASSNSLNVLYTYSRPVLPTTFVEELPFFGTDTNDMEQDPLMLENENQEWELNEPSVSPVEGNYSDTTINDVGAVIEIESADHVTELPQAQKQLIKLTESNSDQSIQTDDIQKAPEFTINIYKHNKKVMHFYTGLETFDKVMLVFHTLGEDAYHLKYIYDGPPKKIDPLNQFFLTLIILRRHRTFEEMSMTFVIPIKQVYNIFVTWIRFMSLQWRNLDLWVDKETVVTYMPLDFHDKYPATRVVVDATECPIKKPKLPLAQQVTFSTYKNKNTVKFLLGITPSGLISYISPCYGGSATDRQIIERSDILNKFDYGDEIMVDKGLNVQDIFLSYGVKVNMPAFFKKGNQIQPDTLTSNRKIASKRVHVERVIGLLKTYKILTEPMYQTEILLSSDITFICAMLVNFRSNIIGKNA